MHAMYTTSHNLVHDETYVHTRMYAYARNKNKKKNKTENIRRKKEGKSKTHLIFMHVKLHVLHEKNQRGGKKNYDELEHSIRELYFSILYLCVFIAIIISLRTTFAIPLTNGN